MDINNESKNESSGEYIYHSLRNNSPVWNRDDIYLTYHSILSGWLIQQEKSFLNEVFDGYFIHSEGII